MRLEELQDGDDRVLREVYSSLRDPFIAWLRGKYRLGLEETKEIFQNAVVIMFENIRAGKVDSPKTKVKTYLFGIGLNLAREYSRSRRRRAGDPSPFLVTHAVDNSGIRDKEQLELNLKLMYRALEKLGDPCKSLLQFFYIEKLSMDAICQLLGYNNTDTAKSKKYKCLQRLRAIFSEQATNEVNPAT